MYNRKQYINSTAEFLHAWKGTPKTREEKDKLKIINKRKFYLDYKRKILKRILEREWFFAERKRRRNLKNTGYDPIYESKEARRERKHLAEKDIKDFCSKANFEKNNTVQQGYLDKDYKENLGRFGLLGY